MRRLTRHALTILSALSLLLCVAVCVLWVWSYQTQSWARRTHARSGGGAWAVTVGNYPGRLAFEYHTESAEQEARIAQGINAFANALPPAVGADVSVPRSARFQSQADTLVATTTSGYAGPSPLSKQQPWQTWSGPTPRTADAYDQTLPDRPDLRQFAGVAWYADQLKSDNYNLLVPHRYVALAAALLPAWCALRFVRRTRRVRRGMCAQCGYDLRASPERCPECGARSAAKGDA